MYIYIYIYTYTYTHINNKYEVNLEESQRCSGVHRLIDKILKGVISFFFSCNQKPG